MKSKRLILIVFTVLSSFLLLSEVSAKEVQTVETPANIGFTGVYEPIGTPDPEPPKDIERPPISEIAKPDGSLPQTNSVRDTKMVWLGIWLLIFIFLLWKRKKQTQNVE